MEVGGVKLKMGKGPEFLEVEEPFLKHLKELDWDVTIHYDDIGPRQNPSLTERDSFDDLIIEKRLKSSLKNINTWLTEEQIDDVVNEIKRIGQRKGLIQANKEFLELLLDKVPTADDEHTGEKSKNIKIIDFETPTNNDFYAVNQFRVNTPGRVNPYLVADIVLFVNGLPIGIVECKNPNDIVSYPIEEAINQLKRYSGTRDESSEKEGNEKFFFYNQLMIVSTYDEARVGSITSEDEHFLEWKDTYPMELNKKWSSQERLINGLLNKNTLIDMIENFIIFIDNIKIVARYHQYRAVSKIIRRLQDKETPEERSGVVWHTQGSGKSLTNVFLIKKIRTIKDLKQYKIVLITDRNDLENQLSGTVGLAEKPTLLKTTHDLVKELSTDTSNLVMVMTQKFLKRGNARIDKDLLPEYEEFDTLNLSEDILLCVDEGHRTQGGIFGTNIAKALPNSTKIAFTGTPLVSSRVKKKTIEVFGTYIDKYGMKEAKDDGATLQIKYEGKTVNSRLKNKGKLDTEFEDMFANKTKAELEEIKKKYGTKGNILEAKKRIKRISQDIVKHYFENIFDDGFKAQIVASSRLAAYRYKVAIDESIKEYIEENSSKFEKDKLELMKFVKTALIITYNNNDLEEMKKDAIQGKKDMGEDNINFKSKYNFNKPKSSVGILIVTDMLLTGFDAPIEQVMYVDKIMKDHTLLQAIARVNRVAKGKDEGHIVDYIGIVNHLDKALKDYNKEDIDNIKSAFKNINDEFQLLKYRYNDLLEIFKKHKVKDIEKYVNYQIKDKEKQKEVLENAVDLFEDIKLRMDFQVKFKFFLKSMNTLLSKPIAKDFIKPMKAFGHIHQKTIRRYRDNSINILGAGKKVRRLIDDHLLSIGINTKIPPVDVINENFTKEIEKGGSKKSQASEMAHSIRRHCKVYFNKDPVFYKNISEKLNEILQKYKDDWEKQVKLMKTLVDDVKTGRKEEKDGILDAKTHRPYYDLLVDILYKDKKVSKENESILKELTIQIVNIIEDRIKNKHFWTSSLKKTELENEIDDKLISYSNEIELLYNKKSKIKTEISKLAKNRS